MTIPIGTIIYTAVKPIFKIYLIIGVGFFLAKRNILTVETARNLSDMVVTAIMPCLIFNNIVNYLADTDIKAIGIICLTGTLIFTIGGFSAYLIGFLTKAPKRWVGGVISVGLFANISDLPIAYIQTLDTGLVFTTAEGNLGVAYVCIFLAVQVFFQFNMGLYKLIEWDFREILLNDIESKPISRPIIGNSNEDLNTRLAEKPIISNETDTQSEVSHPDEPIDTKNLQNDSDTESQTSSSSIDPNTPADNNTESDQHHEFLRLHGLSSSSSAVPERLRNRRTSISSNHSTGSMNLTRTRTLELRKQKSQNINDVINEYSEADGLRNHEIVRSVSGLSVVAAKPAESIHSNKKSWVYRYKINYLIEVLENFKRPNSISLIVSLTVAMIPWVKALFVKTSIHMPAAPDSLPPLSFIIDFTSYIGAASVPLGLLILGSTIARLQVKTMPKGFWKTALGLAAARLVFIPIVGVLICTKLHRDHWYGDKMLHFVSVLNWGLPNATSLVYFTAFYTDPDDDEHTQMDCLAVTLIFQYSVLFITLPFLVTYTLKVSMGF